jgi:lipopolysaccharide transport system permease protein
LLLLAGLMFYYRIVPGWGILLVPLLLALAVLAAAGVGALLAALNVAYRDFKYTIPFLVQIWMFATPTVYMNVQTRETPAVQAQAATGQPADAGGATASQAARGRRAGDTIVPGWVKSVLRLNPMTGLIGFFRAAVLGGPLPWDRLGTSAAVIGAVFVAGLMYFRRVESTFADII